MIINTTYFLLPPLEVPNAVAEPAIGLNTPTKTAKLQAVIDSVEYELLLNALGYEQYQELISQFEANGDWIAMPVQKWVDLVDGKDDWRGLRYTVGTNKVSLISYYVYHKMLANENTYFSTTGLVSSDAANAVRLNPTVKLTEVWNMFVLMYQGSNSRDLYNYYNPIFWEWNGYPYSENRSNDVSLYDYMSKNTDLYSLDYFKKYEFTNRFGL